MKVYIVTSGTYSDYHIEAVFSTEEKAKAYIEIHGDYDNRMIEEYYVDVESTEREKAIYIVYISSNGAKARLSESAEPDTIQAYKVMGRPEFGYRLTVETDGAERAKKIATERIAQVKAMPYLFPRLHEECVGYKEYTLLNYPKYNFHTKEIILEAGEFLKR